MRRVTREASLVGLHRRMFEDERPHCIGVTLGAYGELSSSGAHLVTGLGSMRVMAVAALDQSNVYAVAIWSRELRSLLRMTSVAKLGL